MAMAGTNPLPIDWTPEASGAYPDKCVYVKHTIHDLPMFTDEKLIALLDIYPRDKLQIFTMGSDPCDRSEWQPVDNRGVSGADIWAAVAKGRLWVKLMRLDLVEKSYGALVEDLYKQMASQCEKIDRLWTRPLVLISSPGAQVYYHADPQPTMLWQLKGQKRVWIYPVQEQYLSAELMEQIYAGEIDEEAPYESEFDQGAEVFDMRPGDLLCWPLNAPHRVVNQDSVNVSLSIPFGTQQGEQRSQLFLANLWLRRNLGIWNPSIVETGFNAGLKRILFRLARKLKLAQQKNTIRQPYLAKLRIDPSAPHGVAEIAEGPIQTLF